MNVFLKQTFFYGYSLFAFVLGINLFFYLQMRGLYKDSAVGYGLGGLGFDGRWDP